MLQHHKQDLRRCTYCPKLCRFCCPTAMVEHRETVTPWAKMSLAEMFRSGNVSEPGEVGEVFYHCFACLHCRTHCEHRHDVPSALLSARAEVMNRAIQPPEVSSVIQTFARSGNAWDRDLHAGLHQQVDDNYFSGEADAVLFSGCDAIIQDGMLGDMLQLLGVLGVEYLAVFGDRPICCGAPLWQAGELVGFREHAGKLKNTLSRYRLIVCPCPTCVYVFKGLYAEAGLALKAKVIHITEMLLPLVQTKPPKKRLAGKYVFHDPCYLSRFLEQAQLPRQLLCEVLTTALIESVWTEQDGFCCGGGGLVRHVLPEVAAKTASIRMEQLHKTGAEQVISACPGCVRQLGAVPGALSVQELCRLVLDAYRS